MTEDDFLDSAALALLTGRRRKSLQIDQLRRMGIAFYVNSHGDPVVPRTAIEGGKQGGKQDQTWQPKWAA